MIDPDDTLRHVIEPVLRHLDMYSKDAARLLLATAWAESEVKGATKLVQINGPALGMYMIEPDTHDDVWHNWLDYRPEIAAKVRKLIAPDPSRLDQLKTNSAYATAIARIIYRRDPEPLPSTPAEAATYYKRVFNTPKGKAKIEEKMWAFDAAWAL